MRAFAIGVAGLWLTGCAHLPLSEENLGAVRRVAFVTRIAGDSGPRSTVFVDDSSYRPTLDPRHIDDSEADRRLTVVLRDGTKADARRGVKEERSLSRYEIAELLREQTLTRLPSHAPWTKALDPSQVARAFESYLVQEVPANPPDYRRLEPYGVDTIVEIVVESYGMRSEGGKAGVFLFGFARLFQLGGKELYLRRFVSDDLRAGLAHMDPFQVARNVSLFTDRLRGTLIAVARQVALDLSPEVKTPAPGQEEAPPAPLPPPEEGLGEDPI